MSHCTPFRHVRATANGCLEQIYLAGLRPNRIDLHALGTGVMNVLTELTALETQSCLPGAHFSPIVASRSHPPRNFLLPYIQTT